MSTPPAPRRTQLGLSLVEVMIAMVVLAVGLLGLMTLQVMSLRGNAASRGRETATQLAKALLDQVQAEAQTQQLNTAYGLPLPKDFVATFNQAGTATGTLYYDQTGHAVASATGAPFTATWNRLAAKGGTPGTAEYRVEVAWAFETGPGGTPVRRTVSMDRLIAR